MLRYMPPKNCKEEEEWHGDTLYIFELTKARARTRDKSSSFLLSDHFFGARGDTIEVDGATTGAFTTAAV